MNGKDFSTDAVEEVLKRSKQLQNKIRKELRLQAIESTATAELKNPEQLLPFLDDVMLDSIVTDSFQNKSNSPKQINKCINSPSEAVKIKVNTKKLPRNFVNGKNIRDSSLSFHKTSTEVAEKSTKNRRVQVTPLCEESIKASKINFEKNKLMATSSYRLPLQRFAESTNKNSDFFKEHPYLDLDMTSEHTTLFPRRFNQTTETDCLREDGECVNLVEAEVKQPQRVPAVVMHDTWNKILMQNKTNSKHANKILQLKKTEEVVKDSSPKCLKTESRKQIEEPDKSYDIISLIPPKGIFTLQTQSQHLAKQNKCNFQRLPVLYIKPECRIQKLASISICGKSESIFEATKGENPSRNVKYSECKHGDKVRDGEKTFDLEIILDEAEIDIKEKDNINEDKAKENKFFKALDFTNLYEYSSTNSASSPLSRQSSSSSRLFSSLSSNSSLKKVNPSTKVNELHHSLPSQSKRIFSHRVTNDSVKMCKYVQTVNDEYKETVSTNTSPLHYPIKSPPQSDVTTSANVNNTIKNVVENDIVAKIFERIRKDLPERLEVYKNHNTSSAMVVSSILPISPSDEEHNQGRKSMKHQNQTPASKDKSNFNLLPNQTEPLLQCVQEKGIEYRQDSPSSIVEAHKEVLMQQNTLFVQTFNKSSSATLKDVIADLKSIKAEIHEYPTDSEIKRAVKIFINSLTLNGCGSEKKTIIDDNSKNTKRKSITPFESQLISRNRHNKFTSSDSSNICYSLNKINFKRVENTVRWCGTSGSCTSTSLSSTNLESDNDLTIDMQSLSTHSNNISDGEIKSIGEI